MRGHLVDQLQRRLALVEVPADVRAVAVEKEEVVLHGLELERPHRGAAVVVHLRWPQVVALRAELAHCGEEKRQVAVEEAEVGVTVPADRRAVAHAAEQEPHDHPVPVGERREREGLVQAHQPAAPALLETAPAKPVDELVEPAHAAEYSRGGGRGHRAQPPSWPQIRRIWSSLSRSSRCCRQHRANAGLVVADFLRKACALRVVILAAINRELAALFRPPAVRRDELLLGDLRRFHRHGLGLRLL